MNKRSTETREGSNSSRQLSRRHFIWPGLLLAWFVALCFVPDPRPLGAPEVIVKGICSLVKVSEPIARMGATVVLRGMGLAVLGFLLVQSFGRGRARHIIPSAVILAPLLGILALWINYSYFPIAEQIFLAVVSTVMGVLLGYALRRNGLALAALIILPIGLFIWGTSTSVSDDLYEDASTTGRYILENADEIPNGDAGFEKLLEVAFVFAENNSHGRDPVMAHRAAILALSIILGEEKVATVADREIDLAKLPQSKKLRRRITVYGRHDLSQHFWVSAGLAVLSDDETSMSVGIAKELMDSAGGSGFSFVDLTADRAGTLFTLAATRSEASARAMQVRIQNGVVLADFIPNPLDLPEGIQRDAFQAEYGGLGGEKTNKVVEEILRRLDACAGLQ